MTRTVCCKSHRKLAEAFEKAQWRKVQQKTVIQAKEGDTQARESQGKLAEAAKKAATSKERWILNTNLSTYIVAQHWKYFRNLEIRSQWSGLPKCMSGSNKVVFPSDSNKCLHPRTHFLHIQIPCLSIRVLVLISLSKTVTYFLFLLTSIQIESTHCFCNIPGFRTKWVVWAHEGVFGVGSEKPSCGNRELRLAEQRGEEADCYCGRREVWKRSSTALIYFLNLWNRPAGDKTAIWQLGQWHPGCQDFLTDLPCLTHAFPKPNWIFWPLNQGSVANIFEYSNIQIYRSRIYIRTFVRINFSFTNIFGHSFVSNLFVRIYSDIRSSVC